MFGGGFFSEDYNGFSMMSHLRSAFEDPNQKFDAHYRCYPAAMMPGEKGISVNYGGKVILPPSALEKLSRLNVSYPMLFEFENAAAQKKTHGGVLEFIAEEGRVYFPYWMMNTLDLEPGDIVHVINTDISQGSFVKLQPQSVNFLDISDHRAVLESALRNFSTLTRNDIFEILYNGEVFRIKVIDVQPDDSRGAVSVIETDLVVDFETPVGYEEHLQEKEKERVASIKGTMIHRIKYNDLVKQGQASTMRGTGSKLNGKQIEEEETAETDKFDNLEQQECPAPLNLPIGAYFFGYPYKPPTGSEEAATKKQSHTFQGAGTSLRSSRNAEKGRGKKSSSGLKDDPINVDA
ncbi:Cdc48-Ufd1-Npl4 complex component Ufd1 [Schizosaccharomyces cryophilus OY26]|uniref:Ubiquitin fusion degradation protein 1 n=1 Tax=Schizosaccharomyces cryophilus (strain OY26 / ATCC MYA-4695 / CBS 11777 / NBRC 106824 / NRRL Y48691) TaxID=653667 RepID=S9W3V0_SCHCR|nr:Cdc48-Ufd1-Npl4 complex component Ufd1 [Schizosaccharomyces cryophilus OY26]EPY52625.1 Cdc48-Ufd1-Npl4 complex component Ufd1 [Schizosaccharomyces cryophilus OY26]